MHLILINAVDIPMDIPSIKPVFEFMTGVTNWNNGSFSNHVIYTLQKYITVVLSAH